MADKDTITKNYMQDSKTFADAFNFLLYGGRQVIKPEQLKPLDTTSIVSIIRYVLSFIANHNLNKR